MKPQSRVGSAVAGWLFLVGLTSAATIAHGASIAPLEWPRVTFRDGVTNTVYQPQLESWDYDTLQAVSAVAVQPRGAAQPTFGTIEFKASTRVNRADRVVFLENLEIIHGSFPSAGTTAEAYLATLRSLLPREVTRISLDRMEACLAILQAHQRAASQPLINNPPKILVSTRPAMLVPVDGPPVYRPVEKTDLDRVLNTRALILRNKAGTHFLHLFDGYLQAPGLNGPWTIAAKVPSELKKAENQAVKEKQVDLLAGQPNPQTKQQPSLKSTPVPTLYVSSVPTELIVIQGEPKWTPIPSTQLLYVTNTSAHVFKQLADQKIYVLISGRWFRSASFEGPWEFVPGAGLPKDFAAIPDDSPQENVKASVPGTRQAEEAIIADSIPSTVKVDRRKAKMDPPPQCEGSVELQPIKDTPLSYVINCATPVLTLDARTWYACQNGVWFVAKAFTGPWTAATEVPAAVYSIPPGSPLHYVVYVKVYRYDADYIWEGTTPGYYGTVVGTDGTVVYGTGYVYPAYVGSTVYVCYPVTYGYGCNPCWTPWVGWSYGFAVGWAMSDDYYWWCACPPAPYWGPYWYPCYGAYYNAYGGITAWGPYGWAGTSGYIYHQNGPWTGVSRAAAGYNAWTGNQWATQYGRAYNSTTGTRAVGQRGAVENVYTGNYAYGGRGAFYNEQTGAAGAGRKVTWGNEDTGKEGSAGKATVYNPKSGEVTHISGAKGEDAGIIRVNDQVIAGKDGNYYRPDGQGGWEQIVRPPTGSSPRVPEGSVSRPDTAAQKQYSRGGGTTVPRLDSVPPNQYNRAPVSSATRPDPRTQSQWSQMQPSAANQQRYQQLNNELGARQMGAQRQQSFQANRPALAGGGGGGRRR